MTVMPIVVCALGLKNFGKDIRTVEDQWKNRDHLDHIIVEIGQNTEKSPGDLRRLAMTQTPLKDYQLMRVGKTCEEKNNNSNTI